MFSQFSYFLSSILRSKSTSKSWSKSFILKCWDKCLLTLPRGTPSSKRPSPATRSKTLPPVTTPNFLQSQRKRRSGLTVVWHHLKKETKTQTLKRGNRSNFKNRSTTLLWLKISLNPTMKMNYPSLWNVDFVRNLLIRAFCAHLSSRPTDWLRPFHN